MEKGMEVTTSKKFFDLKFFLIGLPISIGLGYWIATYHTKRKRLKEIKEELLVVEGLSEAEIEGLVTALRSTSSEFVLLVMQDIRMRKGSGGHGTSIKPTIIKLKDYQREEIKRPLDRIVFNLK